MVARKAHEPGEETATRHAGAGEDDEGEGRVKLGKPVDAEALDTRPKGRRPDAAKEEQKEEQGPHGARRKGAAMEREGNDERGNGGPEESDGHNEPLEVALGHVVAEASTPEEHPGREDGCAEGAYERARLEVQAYEAGRPEGEAVFAAAGEEHRGEIEPETPRAQELDKTAPRVRRR